MPRRLSSAPWPILALATGLVVVTLVYSLAWTGTLHYDDEPNLNGLYGVEDPASALNFALTGEAGPTGRPVSLASFAWQHSAWPDPGPFLVVNTVIHSINAILVFLLGAALLRMAGSTGSLARWLPLLVAMLWMASPFLASAILVVVQRMTLISGFFVFLTLFLYCRTRITDNANTVRSAFRLGATVSLGTLLAGVSKENGFLLPVFILLIEWLLVPARSGECAPLNRKFLVLFLAIPTLAILGYLAYRGVTAAGYDFRPFTMLERLLTQARVMVDYLRHLLIPAPTAITPFHDSFQPSRGLLSPPTTLLAILIVSAVALLACWVRRAAPMVTFGLLFFLVGHSIESTVIPLELYYPHRNYVPAVGLYFAAGYGLYLLAGHSESTRRLLGGFALAYVAAFIAVLAYGTSLWGNRWESAEIWYRQDPDSVRAAQYLYRFHSEQGNAGKANQLIGHFIERNPGDPMFSLQALAICSSSEDLYSAKLKRALSDLRQQSTISVSIASPIREFAAQASENQCPHFGVTEASALIDAAWSDKGRFVHAKAKQHLLYARAQIADREKEYQQGIIYLDQAMKIQPKLEGVLLTTYFYVESGQRHEAIEYLKNIIEDPPVSMLRSIAWKTRLKPLLETLRSAQEGLDSRSKESAN